MCEKKKLTHKQALGFLHYLKDEGYSKNPKRNEVAFYKCKKCNTYHLSSKVGVTGEYVLEKQNYFDFQKNRWKEFLLNHSKNKARI